MIEITSKTNEKIKNLRKLRNKKYRILEKSYIVDGYKLCIEASQFKKNNFKEVFISKSYYTKSKEKVDTFLSKLIDQVSVFLIEDYIFESISTFNNSEGILAVLSFSEDSDSLHFETKFKKVIPIFENISDPHNLGSVLRVVSAVGIKDIIVTSDSTDKYNEKVLRASMGAVFKVNVHKVDSIFNLKNEFTKFNKKINFVGADMNGENLFAFSEKLKKSFENKEFESLAIVFGNEANGLKEETQKLLTQDISIPMIKETESLNLSTATAVILYEIYRALGFAF